MGEPWLDIGYDMNQFRKDMAKADKIKDKKMGKVKDYYTNELLLEREDEIRGLSKENVKLHKNISSLRFALLKIQSSDTDGYYAKIIKKALNND